jgi:hypothetical protein
VDPNAFSLLLELNQNADRAIAVMEKFAEYPQLNTDTFNVYRSSVREYISDANLLILHALENSEQKIMLEASRKRVAYEKTIRDPDDCYFDVLHREAERRELGLPSMIGVTRGMTRESPRETLARLEREEAAEEDEDEPAAEERPS